MRIAEQIIVLTSMIVICRTHSANQQYSSPDYPNGWEENNRPSKPKRHSGYLFPKSPRAQEIQAIIDDIAVYDDESVKAIEKESENNNLCANATDAEIAKIKKIISTLRKYLQHMNFVDSSGCCSSLAEAPTCGSSSIQVNSQLPEPDDKFTTYKPEKIDSLSYMSSTDLSMSIGRHMPSRPTVDLNHEHIYKYPYHRTPHVQNPIDISRSYELGPYTPYSSLSLNAKLDRSQHDFPWNKLDARLPYMNRKRIYKTHSPGRYHYHGDDSRHQTTSGHLRR